MNNSACDDLPASQTDNQSPASCVHHAMLPPTRLCVQCQYPVSTRFCGNCGREVRAKSVLTDTALHSIQTLTNIDGRWRRTMTDLTLRPGVLLQRYLSDGRHLYANPILMLLVLTSLSLLLLDYLQVDYFAHTDTSLDTSQMQWLVQCAGYFALFSNILTAALSARIYPGTQFGQRFIVLTFMSVFIAITAFPLMMLAYLLDHDMTNTPLLWVSNLAGIWVLWQYQRSLKQTLQCILLSYLVLCMLVALLGMLAGMYFAVQELMAPLRTLTEELGWSMHY